MEINRRKFFKSVGGSAAVALMTSSQKAEALEHFMEEELEEHMLDQGQQTGTYPTVAELAEQDKDLTRRNRRGAGGLFVRGRDGNLPALRPMPEKPTLLDFFKYRFRTVTHNQQSAARALQTGMNEKVVLACLLHDVILDVVHPDHGWWGAQLIEPYVPEETTFAVRYHSTLRFFPDSDYGYEYPESYLRTFGEDYVPEPYLQRTYQKVRNHKWYEHSRLVTVNDLYAFDRSRTVSIEPFIDIIGRHFKQPKEGLGWDDSSSSHMWRTINNPDRRL